MKALVREAHAPVHVEVLVAGKGERLRVVREDKEWPGWLWCVAETGIGSWTPEPYLKIDGTWARLLVDYDATELRVAPGDVLALAHEVNGWWWATAENGQQGWVPAEKLQLA